jgi:hypothetical protein
MNEYYQINREFYRGNELIKQSIMMFLLKEEADYQLKRINNLDPFQTKYKYSILPQEIEFKEDFKPGDRIIYRNVYAKVIKQDHQWLFTDVFKPIDVTQNLVLWAGDFHGDMCNNPKINYADNCSWMKTMYEDRSF